MSRLKHARIVCLIKNDLTVEVMNENLDDDLATIWLKIGSNKKKGLLVGGIYRQHKLLGEQQNDATRLDSQHQQENRWRRICKIWKNKSKNKKTVVVGDINLDHLRWDHPEQHLENMVEETKNVIETSGFLQIVTNFTRSWRNQADSCLDQVWTNCPDRTVKVYNIERGASYHNVVGINVAVQDIKTGGNNTIKRLWKSLIVLNVSEDSNVLIGVIFWMRQM